MQATVKTASQSQIDTIDSMLSRISAGQEKRAAEANTEAGGFQGETTHPVKNVDDRTEDAQEGARSAENTADVKEDQGSPAVDNTSPGTPGGQDSVQLNIGTEQAATGEDSSVETESAKGGKEDPGTQRGESSHPARTDNDALDGHKYSSLAAQVIGLVKGAQVQGTELIAQIASESDAETQKRAQEIAAEQAGRKDVENTTDNPTIPAPKAKEAAEDAARTGYDLADAVSRGGLVEGEQKQAQDEMIVTAIEETITQAYHSGDKTAEFLNAYDAEKRALGEASGDGGATHDPREEEEEEENGGAPAAGGEVPAEAAGNDEEALLSLLAGGDNMGGEEALGEMAGATTTEAGPPGAEGGLPGMGGGLPGMGGGPPGAEGGLPGMGGGPPGAEGGLPGMGGGLPGAEGGLPGMGGGLPGAEGGLPGAEGGLGEEELAMLIAALQQAGITPDAFEAAASARAAKTLQECQKQGGAKVAWQPKTAAEAQALQRMVNYVKEVTGT